MRAAPLVVARERNVICVDFRRKPEPPSPTFPGAGAARAFVPVSVDAHVQAEAA